MRKRLILIGHVTEDIADSGKLIGGGVTYIGITAKELGMDVQIITKLPSGHRYIDYLTGCGIKVINLPNKNNHPTATINKFDSLGYKTIVLKSRQDQITLKELVPISFDHLVNPLFVLAPVMDEVDMEIILYLSKYGSVAISAQGFFRKAKKNGDVIQKEWSGFEEDLSSADIVSLGEEEILVGGKINSKLLERIKKSVSITILTMGAKGARVYQESKKEFHVYPFSLEPDETKEFTGAGDVFEAAYIAKFIKTGNHHDSGVFAAFASAIKIIALGGLGVDSIPTKHQLQDFISQHPARIRKFLEINHSTADALTL